MADSLGAKLKERVVHLTRIGELYPAELTVQVQLRLVGQVEVHNLVPGFRNGT